MRPYKVFKRGEVLYRMGQPVEFMYVIRGGSVKTGNTTARLGHWELPPFAKFQSTVLKS